MSKKNVGTAGSSAPVLDIYGRVSRLADKRIRSVEGQLLDCRTRVEEYGATVGEVLADPGRSAWNPRVKRPDWDALMERLESGVSNGVCVFDLSRFSRQPMEGERLIEVAQRGLVVLDSEREFDLSTPDGKASFRDQMKMAAYYSDRLSTVSKRGKRLKAMHGEPNSSQRAFGFEPDGVTLRMTEVDVMREGVRRLLGEDTGTPESLDSVVADINARGIHTTFARCPKHNVPEGTVCGWCGRRNAVRGSDGTWTSPSFKQMLLKPCTPTPSADTHATVRPVAASSRRCRKRRRFSSENRDSAHVVVTTGRASEGTWAKASGSTSTASPRSSIGGAVADRAISASSLAIRSG
jgi:DNA invertase Pin-like site-specific DNA recombinase